MLARLRDLRGLQQQAVEQEYDDPLLWRQLQMVALLPGREEGATGGQVRRDREGEHGERSGQRSAVSSQIPDGKESHVIMNGYCIVILTL